MACQLCDEGSHSSCSGTSMEGSSQQFTDGQGTYTMTTTTIKCCDGVVINQINSRS